MAEQQNQKKVIDATQLSIGVHQLGDDEVHGSKYYKDCEAVQTWAEWLKGTRTTYSFCWSLDVVAKKTVVRPREGFHPSDDLRTSDLNVGEIVTLDGRKCVSAKAPFKIMDYQAHASVTIATSELDTNTDFICVKGLHFWAHLDALKKDAGNRGLNYTSKTRDSNGITVEDTKHRLPNDWNVAHDQTTTRKYDKTCRLVEETERKGNQLVKSTKYYNHNNNSSRVWDFVCTL